jgi:Na+-transporting methylmalonyl-CoA/oxaloacetate decarboxylase gamma subunit
VNRLVIIFVVILVLIISGGLTAQLTTNRDAADFFPVLKQVDSPDGSTLAVVPWKAEQMILLVGFVLFNLIGMAATIALVMWLLHRFVKQAKESENQGTAAKAVEPARAGRSEAAQKT